MKIFRTFALVLAAALLGWTCVGRAQSTSSDALQSRLDPDNWAERDARRTIAEAGYSYSRESLSNAMHDDDFRVASMAIYLVSQFPASEPVISTLRDIGNRPDEALAVAAFRSLLRLKAHGWEEEASHRLPEMKDYVSRIVLAGVLAQSGRADGWKFMKEMMAAGRSSLVGMLAENIVYFDGLYDEHGASIDAARELEVLSAKVTSASPGVRGALESSAKTLKQHRDANLHGGGR